MKININTFSAVFFSLFLFSQCMIVSGIGSILQNDGKKSDSSLLGLLALAGGSGSNGIEQVVAPTFSLAAGHYNTAQTTTISTTTSGASVYFTTDGTTPTTSSNLYSNPIHIWSLAGKTLKAIATKSGLSDSSVTTLAGFYSYPPLKTGQTTVYATGDDGTHQTGVTRSYTGPTQHATYTSDYTTTEDNTGLVWKSCRLGLSASNCSTGASLSLNWVSSNNEINGCNSLNLVNNGVGYAGRQNWHLPSRRELETLGDYGKTFPAMNTTSFPNNTTTIFWSSSVYAFDTNSAWLIHLDNSRFYSQNKPSAFPVLCVSSFLETTNSTFTDNNNGTINDNSTNLTWQKCSLGQNNDSTCSGLATTLNWASAINYCNSLTLASKVWRLPNLNELRSILDITRNAGPSLNIILFPSTPSSVYWTSTTYLPDTVAAWYLNFGNAYNDNAAVKSAAYYVRCVAD
jgi:hypothetical protein